MESKVHLVVRENSKEWLLSVLPCIPLQKQLVLLYPYCPAMMIPHEMGVGALVHQDMLSVNIVRAYRESERRRRDATLADYQEICMSNKFQAEVHIIENNNVAAGLLELIVDHTIETLIMEPGKHWIMGGKSMLAATLEKKADPSCNILHLKKGNLVSIRPQRINASTAGNKEKSSPVIRPFLSGSSDNTRSTSSSSFWDSRSMSGFDAAELDDPSLQYDVSVFDDNRFSVIGHDALSTLKELGERLIPAQHSHHLHQAFRTNCYDILAKCQRIVGIDSVLGVDCMNSEEAHWKAIKSWPPALECIVGVLKAMQAQLAKQKRGALNGLTHNDLSVAAKEPISRLLEFASAVTKLTRSPEKLFHILHMYGALTDASPTLREVFSAELVSVVEGILMALKDTAREILSELKEQIRTYGSEKVPQGGSIHPISGYLMKYITLLVNHAGSLDTILEHGGNLLVVDGMNSTGRVISGLISELDSMLEKKSMVYASKALQCIFLINNAHFILQEVEQSETRLMLGAKWIQERRCDIDQYKTQYVGVSWAPVISHLKIPTSPSRRKRIRTTSPFDFFFSNAPLERFESSFKKTCEAQIHWKVPDPLLRGRLRGTISKYVVEAYRAYSARLKQSNTVQKTELEFKLNKQISELFEG